MTVHVVGAGLAGLAAAVELTAAGVAVAVHEAAPRAGGRCRSYHDAQLGLEIDNGNHLVLSGNRAVRAYLARIGASDRLRGSAGAAFPFADAHTGERWTVRPSMGAFPWWLFLPSRRVPGTRLVDYLRFGPLLGAKNRTVADYVPTEGALWDRLFDPVLLAALNTPAAGGSAKLAGRVLRETMAKGGAACRPLVAHPTLAAAFVDPAVAWLAERGVTVATGQRLRMLHVEHGRIAGLDFGTGVVPLGADDAVILAVTAPVAAELVPGLAVPTEFSAIVSAHFAFVPPTGTPHILGLTGAVTEWIFAFEDRLSVTVSAADRLVDTPREDLAALLWAEVAGVMGLPADLPRWQVVKERRATFSATPEQDALRPGQRTPLANLTLAGDWVQTGLPATIEGALRSGVEAARLAQAAAK